VTADREDPRASGPDVPAPLVFRWSKETLLLEALERTVYSMADQMTATVSASNTEWILECFPRDLRLTEDQLAQRVRLAVNDHQLRVRLEERNGPIRNLVFALAFSRTNLSDQGEIHATDIE